jgi:hypothetical protein
MTARTNESTTSRYALHGPPVEIECSVSSIDDAIRAALRDFEVSSWPPGFVPAGGSIQPYDTEQVLRRLSPTARQIAGGDGLFEVYEDGERYWLVDERWGMCEVNMLKGEWRSWVLPNPKVDATLCVEGAVLWPMAQLLRAKGIFLVPAVSAVRDGWAVLLVCPFTLEQELSLMIRSGYKLIGHRWTALREEDGRIAMLHMPGSVERAAGIRRLRLAGGEQEQPQWMDLSLEYPGSWQNHAFCDAVVVVEAGRRAQTAIAEADANTAADLLRRAWPIIDLHPQRRHCQMPSRLAALSRCAQAQLSRSPKQILDLLDSLRTAPPGRTAASGSGQPALALTPWAGLDSQGVTSVAA